MKITNAVKNVVALGIAGLFISIMVLYIEQRIILTYEGNQPYLALGEYLKNNTTRSHLWLEEAMSGDNSIDVQKQVLSDLKASADLLGIAITGGVTPIGEFEKTEDPEINAILNESIKGLLALRASADERWTFYTARLQTTDSTQQATQGEEAGGLLDQQFDKSYEELQGTFEKLITTIKSKVATEEAQLNTLSWISIAIIAVVFLIFIPILYRVQRRGEKLVSDSLNKLSEETTRLNVMSQFIDEIARGNFQHSLETNDELGLKLVNMKDKLAENYAAENKRMWASTGMAKISEILRNQYESSQHLYDAILSFLVKYTNSNQGSLFILNDDDSNDQELVLVAAYAFDRKKYLERTVKPGEGLLGQCFLEKEHILMTDVPKDYIRITSGLGGATPRSLLIMPVKLDKEVYGILELASFQVFETHEVELIRSMAESIAATISTVRINERTRILLEKTQQQTEEMRAQEEEMRQNMEELAATQEEMSRKEQEYILKIRALEAGIDSSKTNLHPIHEVLPREDSIGVSRTTDYY